MLTGIVEVVLTCSRQPQLKTCSKSDNNNYNVPFLHVFNRKSNKHKHKHTDTDTDLLSLQRRCKLKQLFNVTICIKYKNDTIL